MNLTPKLAILLAAAGLFAISQNLSAQTTLQLQAMSSFGTNGNGSILPNQLPYLTDGGTNSANRHEVQRSMAYNPTTGHLLVLSRTNLTTGDPYYIGILDANTGADLGSLQLGIPGVGGDIGFDYNLITVADDGSIYVCDMSSKTSTSGSFNVYRWADESSFPQQIFGNIDPGNGSAADSRWGDTLTVRGSGMGTQILVSSRGSKLAILTPIDPTLNQPWSGTTLQSDVTPGFIGYGLAFGAGNTLWAQAANNPLYEMSFDTIAGTATTLHTYGTTVFPGWTGALAVNTASNLLASVEMPPNTAANVRLHDISNLANPPVLLDREAWATNDNVDGIFAGTIVFGNNAVYALESDNGIMAFNVVSGPARTLAPSIILNPANVAASLENNSSPFIAAADGIPTPTYHWYFNTNTAIADATSTTLIISNIAPANYGVYTLVASNSSGSVTSAPAILSEAVAFKNGVLYEPFNYTAGTALQGQGGWVTNTASASQSFIEAGSLSANGLAAPMGNHYAWASNITLRLPFGTLTNGPVYFSFLVQITQLGTVTGEDTFAGLAYYTSTSLYPKVDANVINSNAYQIGMFKGSGTTGNGAYYTNVTFTTNDVVFVVGRLVVNTNTTSDDTCDLWVNPDPVTFGTSSAPPPTVANINGKADQIVSGTVSGVDRFSWRGITSGIKHSVDELRVGFTWASVTAPTAVSLKIAKNNGNVIVSWPTNNVGWQLESATSLTAPTWVTNSSVVVQGTNNTATVSASGPEQFFRLSR